MVNSNTKLTKSNFKLYCAQNYYNVAGLDEDQFKSDLKLISQLKRMISDYVNNGEIKDRLILNNIITISNLFGPEHTVRMLFFKIENKYYPALKTFCKYLHIMPQSVTGLAFRVADTEIPVDRELLDRLAKL